MDGYQVARELRRSRELDRSVLVALTGYGQEEDRLRSREAGFDEHLVKPASIDDLQRVLSMTR
jgi:CheY-like chemotaxis protein